MQPSSWTMSHCLNADRKQAGRAEGYAGTLGLTLMQGWTLIVAQHLACCLWPLLSALYCNSEQYLESLSPQPSLGASPLPSLMSALSADAIDLPLPDSSGWVRAELPVSFGIPVGASSWSCSSVPLHEVPGDPT